MNFTPEILNLIGAIREALPKLKARKAEIHARLKLERQCTATTKGGDRCKAWSVWGDVSMRCGRHGGKKTAKTDACRCEAYKFPHRRRSGLCNHPEKPFGKSQTAAGKRRYQKRQRKAQIKNCLKELGLKN